MSPFLFAVGILLTSGCSIVAIVLLVLKTKAEKVFRSDLRAEMQLIRTDAGSAIEATRNELASHINSFKGALDQAITHLVASTKKSQENADTVFLQFKNQIDTAMRDFNQSISTHLEGIRTNEAKSLEDIRQVIDTKLKIATEKMMEEGYRVQKERLALSTQKAHFLQFSETLDVVSRTISSAAESLSAASKRGRDITEKLIKDDSISLKVAGTPEPSKVQPEIEIAKRRIA